MIAATRNFASRPASALIRVARVRRRLGVVIVGAAEAGPVVAPAVGAALPTAVGIIPAGRARRDGLLRSAIGRLRRLRPRVASGERGGGEDPRREVQSQPAIDRLRTLFRALSHDG